MQPKIAIVGAGAVGVTLACAMGDSGLEPELVVRRPFNGPAERTLDGDTRHYQFRQIDKLAEARPVDWVILATKSYQTAGVADWLGALSDDRTVIAVAQNGVDQVERLSAYHCAKRKIGRAHV